MHFLKNPQIVLIGDHLQLEPVTTCRRAANGGLKKSMFERLQWLAESLTEQYRMVSLKSALTNFVIVVGNFSQKILQSKIPKISNAICNCAYAYFDKIFKRNTTRYSLQTAQ